MAKLQEDDSFTPPDYAASVLWEQAWLRDAMAAHGRMCRPAAVPAASSRATAGELTQLRAASAIAEGSGEDSPPGHGFSMDEPVESSGARAAAAQPAASRATARELAQQQAVSAVAEDSGEEPAESSGARAAVAQPVVKQDPMSPPRWKRKLSDAIPESSIELD